MYVDLLNLSDESRFYLKQLLKNYGTRNGSSFLNKTAYDVWSKEYVAPSKVDDNPIEDESTEAANIGLCGQIYGYLTWAIKFFPWFYTPLPEKPKNTTSIYSRNKNHVIELSHHLLVNREGGQYQCYIVDKKGLGAGAFGAVFDSPAAFVFDSTSDELTYKQTSHIAKNVKSRGSAADVQREFKHLKMIFPSTALLDVSQIDTTIQNRSSIFDMIFKSYEHWIVTQKIDGVSLDKININELTTPQKFKVALSLIWDLYLLQTPSVYGGLHIHNDIKPSNIVMTKEFDAHFCDFGSATFEGEPVRSLTMKYTDKTGFSKPATKAGDIYSLGITLFQLFLSSRQVKDEANRWLMLPKGKNEKLHKTWHIDKKSSGLVSTKVLESDSQKTMYKIFHHSTKALVCDVDGLDKEQQIKLFKILKQMRTENPPPIEESYMGLMDLAVQVDGFDIGYFSDKKIKQTEANLVLSPAS